jgi:hypothetical protein
MNLWVVLESLKRPVVFGALLIVINSCVLHFECNKVPSWIEPSSTLQYIDRGKPMNSEKDLSQCHYIHHKPHMDWPGREPGPPRWQAGDLSHGTALYQQSRRDKPSQIVRSKGEADQTKWVEIINGTKNIKALKLTLFTSTFVTHLFRSNFRDSETSAWRVWLKWRKGGGNLLKNGGKKK